MSISKARIIIVTSDVEFYSSIRPNLVTLPRIESVFSTTSLMNIGNRVSSSLKNIVVIDVNCSPITFLQLKNTVKQYGCEIVLIGFDMKKVGDMLVPPIKYFITKPVTSIRFQMLSFTTQIDKIIVNCKETSMASTANVVTSMNSSSNFDAIGINDKLIVLGSSTGGPKALEAVLTKLPKGTPPVLVVQHMPMGFIKPLADRLDKMSQMTIKEAEDLELVKKNHILIAPPDKHMTVILRNGKLQINLTTGVKVNGVMPSVDILFDSVSNISPRNTLGVILTGMGADGAKGLKILHDLGSKTISQSEDTCVVYGMPKAAYELGAVDYVVPLEGISTKISTLI